MTTETTLPVKDAIVEAVEDANRDAMVGELDALKLAAVDAVTDTRRLTVEVTGLENPPSIYDRVRLVAQTDKGPMPLRVLAGAHEQLGEKAGIPVKYYERMLKDAPDLLATNLNRWNNQEPGMRLVRMLKPMNGETSPVGAMNVRAVLSNRYRVMDHGSLVNAVLPVLDQHGLRVADFKLTETHFYLRVVGASIAVRQMLPAMGWDAKAGVTEEMLNEVVGFGAAIRNSETGHGALTLDPMFEVKRCLNRIVVDYYEKVRAVHVGRKLDEDMSFYAADTQTLDTAALFLKMRDRLAGFFSGDAREKAAVTMVTAMGAKVDLPADVSPFTFIDNVSASLKLSEHETEVLKEEVVHELAVTGRSLSPWAVSQGLTATARRIGEEGSMERRDDLEHLGWRVLDDPVQKLLKAGGVK